MREVKDSFAFSVAGCKRCFLIQPNLTDDKEVSGGCCCRSY
jgi:hypothetical protein